MAGPDDDPSQLMPFDPGMLQSDLDPRFIARFPSGLGWRVGREHLDPWEVPGHAEISNYPSGPRPEPYLEKGLNDMPLGVNLVAIPGSAGAGAIPSALAKSLRSGSALEHILASPGAAVAGAIAGPEAAGLVGQGVKDALPYAVNAAGDAASSLFGSAAQAEDLPQNQWFTPKGDLKIGPNSSPNDIKAMQTFLKGSGEYKGAIDGVWGSSKPGSTADAASTYGARMRQNYQSDQALEAAKANAAAAAAKAEGDKATAGATQSATDLKAQEDAKHAADAAKLDKFTGDYRTGRSTWEGLEENHPVVSGIAKALAYAAGGYATQRLTGGVATSRQETAIDDLAKQARGNISRATRADLSNPGQRADAAGELNEWWANSPSGNPQGNVPFKFGTRGVTYSPKGLPPATDLYQPRTLADVLMREGIGVGAAGLENAGELYRGWDRAQAAQQEYNDAKAAYDKAGYTDEGARRLLSAEDNLKTAQSNFYASIGSGTIGGMAGAVHGATGADRSLPKANQARADALRERLRQSLKNQ